MIFFQIGMILLEVNQLASDPGTKFVSFDQNLDRNSLSQTYLGAVSFDFWHCESATSIL